MKGKNHMIRSINIEKALKNSTSFYNNNKEPLDKSGREETYLNIMKGSMTSPQLTSISMVESWKLLRTSGMRQACSPSSSLNIVLKVQARAMRKKKK